MKDPRRVCVTGPLAIYREGFCEELERRGYTSESASCQVRVMAHLSRWLDDGGIGAGDLTPAGVESFLEAMRSEGRRAVLQRGLTALMTYLEGLGGLPVPVETELTPAQMLLAQYRCYLVNERGAAPATVDSYLRSALLFQSCCGEPPEFDLTDLTAGEVVAFVVEQCGQRRVAAAQSLMVGLRSLLRFLFVTGRTEGQLALAVPTPTGWAGGSLPRALDEKTVAALLDSCDRNTTAGWRNQAIVTLMARLGLRAGEVAGLNLDDIDWHHGELVIRGKGGRQDRLPLPVDVGEALAGYLQQRPSSQCRAVFLRLHAPRNQLTAGGVGCIVAATCRRAGVPAAGAHRLRHRAATAMLRGGASLAEVGQVLRQVHPATTAIYAKVDRVALRALAQPWPGGTS
jgi:integrase/recombinase XerD